MNPGTFFNSRQILLLGKIIAALKIPPLDNYASVKSQIPAHSPSSSMFDNKSKGEIGSSQHKQVNEVWRSSKEKEKQAEKTLVNVFVYL